MVDASYRVNVATLLPHLNSGDKHTGARLAGLPLTSMTSGATPPDITKELDALLSENPKPDAPKQKPKNVESSDYRTDPPPFGTKSVVESSNFRADAPAFIPQSLRHNNGMHSASPDSGATGTGRQMEDLDALLSGNPAPESIQRAAGVPTPPGLKALHVQSQRSGPVPAHYLPPSNYAASTPQLNSFAGAPDPAGGVRLFEDQWSAEAVPDALKELWVPPGLQQSHVLATVPPKSPTHFPQPPPMYPYESPPVNADGLKTMWTPSTAVPDSPPYTTTPSPYNVPMPFPQLLLPQPAPPSTPPPPVDYMFSMRELLLKFRASMGKVPHPWDLKLRYSIVDEQELSPSEYPGSPAGNAGATLLRFVKGEASESEVLGKAKGAELMQMLQPAERDDDPPCDNLARLLGLSAQTTEQDRPDNDWELNRAPWKHDIDADAWKGVGRKGALSENTWSHNVPTADQWSNTGRRPNSQWAWNGLPDGVLEAKEYKDGNMYVQVNGRWLWASARYYCAYCQLFGNAMKDHVESSFHKKNIGMI